MRAKWRVSCASLLLLAFVEVSSHPCTKSTTQTASSEGTGGGGRTECSGRCWCPKARASSWSTTKRTEGRSCGRCPKSSSTSSERAAKAHAAGRRSPEACGTTTKRTASGAHSATEGSGGSTHGAESTSGRATEAAAKSTTECTSGCTAQTGRTSCTKGSASRRRAKRCRTTQGAGAECPTT